MKKSILGIALGCAMTTPAIAIDHPAYWVGSDGEYVRSGFGECVRTINWTPEKAIAGCEGDDAGAMKKKAAAPVKKPEPAKSTTSAAPAPAKTAPAPVKKAEPQYRNLSLSSGATFALGGSELSQSGKDAVASILRQFEGEKIKAVLVEGHTDDRGAAAFNQQLSEKRAAAVRDELIKNGIDASLITTRGFGESRPIASNDTRDGRAKNRRVDIKIDASTRQL